MRSASAGCYPRGGERPHRHTLVETVTAAARLVGALPVIGALACAPTTESSEPHDEPRSSDDRVRRWPVEGHRRGRECMLTTEGLVQTNPDGTRSPLLATSWQTTEHPDGTRSVSFTLKEGIGFHDGTPLDAGVVKRFLDDSKNRPVPARRAILSLSDIDDASRTVGPLEGGHRPAPGLGFPARRPHAGNLRPGFSWDRSRARGPSSSSERI